MVLLMEKLYEGLKEKLKSEGNNQIEQLINERMEKHELDKFIKNLNENILEKYGDELFFDDLSNVLVEDKNMERLIERCKRKDIYGKETDNEFIERIMQNESMNSYNKACVKDVLEYVEQTVFWFFNELKDPDHIKIVNQLAKDGERTRDKLDKIQEELESLREYKLSSDNEDRIRDSKFITKSSKKAVNHFKGRNKEIASIIKIMEADQTENEKISLWIYGMGGIGKTQLCRKICSKIYGKYPYLGWIDYQGNFKQAIVNSVNMGEKTDDLEREYEKALRYVNSLGRKLLLFIDNYDMLDSYLGDIESLQCHVIVTSRNSNPETFCGYKIDFLDFSACKELFCYFYTIEKNMIINEIIHKTGYLSLAVELVAKTGQKLGLKLEEYYLKLEERGFDIGTVVQSNWDNTGDNLNMELSKQLSIVFDLTSMRKNGEIMYILKNFSILPYLGITRQEAVEWLALEEDSGSLYDLAESGWLQLSGMEYTMHPVVSFTVVQMESPQIDDSINLVRALSNSILVKPGDNYLKAFNYLPYAESVGEYFVKMPFVQKGVLDLALLYIRISEINRYNGDYDKAYKWGKSSCESMDNAESQSGQFVSLVYNIMSEICLDMRDRNDESEVWALRAIASDYCKEDIDIVECGTSFHNLAGVYIQMENNRKALQYETKALEMRKRCLVESDIRIINCYRNLAMIYRRLGEVKTSLEFHEKVVGGLENIYADDRNHPDFPVAYNLYSFALRDTGEMQKAIEYQEKAIKIREYINEADPKLAINYNNLGMLYLKNGDVEKAIEWEEKAISMDIINRGENHPDVATDFYNYALMLYASGNIEAAIEYLNKSRQIEEKIGGKTENIKEIDERLELYHKKLQNRDYRKTCPLQPQ